MTFYCKIKDLDAYLVTLPNGLFDAKSTQVFAPPQGVHFASVNKDASHVSLSIDANSQVEKPIQIINIFHQEHNQNNTQRISIHVAANATITIIHCDETFDDQAHQIQTEIDIVLEPNAILHYYHLQNINNKSVSLSTVTVNQQENSHFFSHTISFNGQSINKVQTIELNALYSEATVYGLCLLDGMQRSDHTVLLQHWSPSTRSLQNFKGILDNSAQMNFKGHILVDAAAQKTEAFQHSKSLILSDKAKARLEPFLEIYADDVKCSHGATVGQIHDEELFYLKSRGISEKQAKSMLMDAFSNEIVQHITIPALRTYAENLVRRRLSGDVLSCELCALAPENTAHNETN
ncbi:Fe-S cluster assembly protein SufD [Bacteroidia bacterium]|nr:Fe-S cluster assembly protein SufD [Bacteroidia bacterium]